MIRKVAAAAFLVLATVGAPFAGAAAFASAAPGDTYISNPPSNPADEEFCSDQAALANNLSAKGDYARADQVVSAANMKGCRIFTFPTP